VTATQGACLDLEGSRIRWIVGYTPGGGYDAYSRLIEPFLERELGAEVFVDNVTGAGGIVGARTLAGSPADGRALGLFDGPALLMANRRRIANAPALGEDLIPMGRVARLHPILVTGLRSGLRTIDDLIVRARSKPIVFGITGPVSQNFVNCATIADLFGFAAEFLIGYPGSAEIALAIQRGDVDAGSSDVGSTLSGIQARRLVPLLQMGHPSPRLIPELERVPQLGGDDGLAARRPELFTPVGDVGAGAVRARADQLVRFSSLGRLVVAPRGMPDELRQCLETAVSSVLRHPGFRASASASNRPLEVASAAAVREELTDASTAFTGLLPAVERAARRAG
jgi:tripartite-type tricarboxylate transporter receptor subunit TctC